MGEPKDSRLGRGTLRIKDAGLFEGKKVKRRVGKEAIRLGEPLRKKQLLRIYPT